MPLLGEPAPDFSDPLGMLAACHQRMLDLCELLDRLPAWIAEHDVDDEAIAGVRRVLRYFDIAAPLHHADEERDLFPLLDSDPELAAPIGRLKDEHKALDAHWHALAGELRALIADSRPPPGLDATINVFCSAYRTHIDRENAGLLPRARKTLTPEQCARLGASMAARRHGDGGERPTAR